MANNPKPEITFTSEGNGTYTLVIGQETWYGLTLDEVCAVINGKEMEFENER